jgi:type III pantothenate kinase
MIVARLARRSRTTIITREMLAAFVGTSYDTPETLGIDRVLNLLGTTHDAVVISCGTAITVDARIGGRPVWGAIMPGFATAAEGLQKRIPALPLVDVTREPLLAARTSVDSVTNGVLLGTALGAQGLADELARLAPPSADLPVILTGGDAQILERLWPAESRAPIVDEMLVFQGMMAWGKEK